MSQFIHQQTDWPNFTWDYELLMLALMDVRFRQGRLLGKMEALGFELRDEAFLKTLTVDVLKTSEIEGEFLNLEEVRSSVARRLGMDVVGMVPSPRDVDGVVDVLVDATRNAQAPLTKERLCNWHAALFPTGRSGMHLITVGDYRQEGNGPMQVVSGAMGKERVHFEAPDTFLVELNMETFLDWFNDQQPIDPVIKAAVAHLWFLTIHPFDDGNGRLARAIADLQLAKADGVNQRFYSMSSQLRLERKKYYEMLESTQKGGLDITRWLVWFLDCLQRTLENTEETLAKVLTKANFWERNKQTLLNPRQVKMINRLLDDFQGKLSSSKWAKMQKCSQDTALRDIQDLVQKQILVKENSGGRSTSYLLQ